MCAANKVTLVDTLNGTHGATNAAARTLVVIDNGKVVDNLYSTLGTGFLTIAACDTAVLTELAHVCALLVAVTLYNDTGGILDEVNDTVGTRTNAYSAADTLARVYLCYSTLVYANRITRTNPHTVAVAKAGKGAEAVTRVAHICIFTGQRTVILVLLFLRCARTVAGNVCDHLNDVRRLKTEYFGDFLTCSVSAGNTEVSLIG